jgi:hypothetical protein
MRLWHLGLGFSLSLVAFGGVGCAATSAKPTGAGGTGGGSTTTSTAGGDGGGFTTGPGSGGSGGSESCATFSAAAKQASAAMLFVLDRSASMSQQGKWDTAQLAIVQAIDKDAFDSVWMGMTVFPASDSAPPPCLAGIFQNVACGTSILPQVPINLAGVDKTSAAMGTRHQIYDWLVGHSPDVADMSDSSPIYDAMAKGYDMLRDPKVKVDKRFMILITDGGFSCTSITGRMGYSDGLCMDWEYPDTVNALINTNRINPMGPINTFVVGVPGSNSHGEVQGPYATAPYSMRLALSTYAVNGSPDTVDPACDKAKVFTQGGTDPAVPCHFDLSTGAAFNPDALANAIAAIRGKALGCLYALPDPPPGKTIDLALVNVVVTVGGVKATIPKRATPADDCAKDGCWDYSGTQVQLLGKTCADVSAATDAKVDITVGCATIIK